MQKQPPLRRAVAASVSVVLLAACGGSDAPSEAPLPQLSAAQSAAFAGDCADLTAKISSLANTSVTAVSKIAAGTLKVGGQDIPEHCQLTGKMHQRTGVIDGKSYAIGFEMRLPKNWNGRFYHQGNGGIDGSVVTAAGGLGGGPLTNALYQGFAVLSSDAGHSGGTPDFGIDPQARLDYGYQAVGKLTPMAKSVIQAAYGKTPDRSYFGGCSNGGRHALVTAARYPSDYDGILAGAPGYNLPKAATANLAGARLYASVATASPVATAADLATGFTDTERKLLASKVVAKCDALDGTADGMVQDVAACQASFSLSTDVPTCTGARDGTCMSSQQKTVIAKIFSGPTTSTGALIYASFPWDGGVGAGSSATNSGIAFWEFFAPLILDSGATGIIFNATPASPATFNGANFALTTDIDALVSSISASNATYTESAMSFMTPPNPTNMSALRNRGGKVLAYHGVSDSIFSVNDTETWYKGLQNASSMARFYRVPGMGHCSGGPATDQFDMLTPLVNWVEKGQAPEQIIATARGVGNAGGANADVPATWSASRSRPLCAYPKVARYNGAGSIEEAASFVCQ
jgi:pimeloyl-ACP methyl ester carboxylesterase